jgi:hypothetical protein
VENAVGSIIVGPKYEITSRRDLGYRVAFGNSELCGIFGVVGEVAACNVYGIVGRVENLYPRGPSPEVVLIVVDIVYKKFVYLQVASALGNSVARKSA